MSRASPTAILAASLFLAACTPGPPAATLSDGFEGQLAPFWQSGSAGSGRYAPRAIVISRDYARSGESSARVTVHEGDIEQDGGDGHRTERAELDSGKFALLGSSVWYGFSFLVPEDFPVVDNRLVIAQWKQDGAESPLVAERFRAGQHYLTIDAGGGEPSRYPLPAIVPGAWTDMVVHIVYAAGSEGLVEIWANGEPPVSHTGSTAVPGGADRFYNKIGLYRDRWPEPMTLYFDNYAMGRDRASVDPAR